MSLVDIRNLTIEFPGRFGTFTAVRNASLQLERGQIHGLVGESGAGKSTIGAALIGLIPSPGRVASGSLRFDNMDLGYLDAEAHHALRGKRISMIFQDPLTSLNPLLSIEDQLVETIRFHSEASAAEARARALGLLREVGIKDAEARMGDYPHQFSGGMRQRVVIALALCSDPDLIIADEPTTALDVAVQKQILDLIGRLTRERGLGVILITHDIGVIAEVTQAVTVLYHGQVVESGPTADVLGRPRHAYTQSLIAAVPRLDRRLKRFAVMRGDEEKSAGAWTVEGASAEFASDWLLGGGAAAEETGDGDLLSVEGLGVTFYQSKPLLFSAKGHQAVSEFSLTLRRGEVMGLVGESGSGKSTVAKAIVGLNRPSAGRILFEGQQIAGEKDAGKRGVGPRRDIQMVFQDPYSSLNNRRRVLDIIAEPIRAYGLVKGRGEVRKLVASVLELVGLPQDALRRYPHQFSGGQRQRIAVARALVSRPRFLICDEPTSALDVSIQAQILNLLKDLQERFALTILFISHDLPVVRQMSDRIAVMKDGRLVELAEAEAFFAGPAEAYSQALLAETPSLDLLAAPPI